MPTDSTPPLPPPATASARGTAPDGSVEVQPLAARHRTLGWAAIALFAALGLGLEALHAWKSPAYLDAGHEPRRLLLTLAHAHGTLLGLAHLAFASSLATAARPRLLPFAGRALTAATLLLPGGFLLGALTTEGADPGPVALLIPLGALSLIASAATSAFAQRA